MHQIPADFERITSTLVVIGYPDYNTADIKVMDMHFYNIYDSAIVQGKSLFFLKKWKKMLFGYFEFLENMAVSCWKSGRGQRLHDS